MINNRQGGRRRGRGGGRAPNMNPSAGNRQDNRQRGNAAQLLEKYKGLARDAQMQGDRVQSEYYLQFADHYYRILNENRARYEEQRRQQGGYDSDEDEDQEDMTAESGERGDERPMRERSEERQPRGDEEARESRREGNGEYRARRPRGRRPEAEASSDETEERIAADILPPSIGGGDAEEEPRRPARRPRRPRDGEEIAPAA